MSQQQEQDGQQDGRPGEAGPDHPTRAWVERADGAEVGLALAPCPDVPGMWVARPPGGTVVLVGRGDHLRIDRLGPGQKVAFEGVFDAGWVGTQTER